MKVTLAPSAPVASQLVISAGTPENAGAVVSTTSTVNDVESLFNFASVHVQVTVVIPISKTSPES